MVLSIQLDGPTIKLNFEEKTVYDTICHFYNHFLSQQNMLIKNWAVKLNILQNIFLKTYFLTLSKL